MLVCSSVLIIKTDFYSITDQACCQKTAHCYQSASQCCVMSKVRFVQYPLFLLNKRQTNPSWWHLKHLTSSVSQ